MSTGKLERLALLVAVGLAVILGWQNRVLRDGSSRVLQSLSEPSIGSFIPSFTATTLGGDEVEVGSPDPGEAQILYFFLTTCEFCQASVPMVRVLAEGASDTDGGVSFLSVSIDSDPPGLPELDGQGIPDPVVHLGSRRMKSLFKAGRVPRLLVIDQDGRVAYVRTGVIGEKGAVDSVLAVADSVAQSTTREPLGGR